jgi:hypothetical protein
MTHKELNSSEYTPRSLTFLKWIGTSTGIVGALFVALNIPQSGYGFVFFWSLLFSGLRQDGV